MNWPCRGETKRLNARQQVTGIQSDNTAILRRKTRIPVRPLYSTKDVQDHPTQRAWHCGQPDKQLKRKWSFDKLFAIRELQHLTSLNYDWLFFFVPHDTVSRAASLLVWIPEKTIWGRDSCQISQSIYTLSCFPLVEMCRLQGHASQVQMSKITI